MGKKFNILLFISSEKGVIFLKSLIKLNIHENLYIMLKKEDKWEKKFNYKILKLIKKIFSFTIIKKNLHQNWRISKKTEKLISYLQ